MDETVPIGPPVTPDFDYHDPFNSFFSFFDTLRFVLQRPAEFFAGLPRRGNLLAPLLFGVISLTAYSITGTIGNGFIQVILPGFLMPSREVTFSLINYAVIAVATILFAPFTAAVGLFIGAGIYHLLVMMFVPQNQGYEATFRVQAYSSAWAAVAAAVAWIPFLGLLAALVGGIYALYLQAIGIREMHSTTTGRAAAIVLIPFGAGILLACCAVIFFIFVFAAILSSAGMWTAP